MSFALRVGARPSDLAIAQAALVKDALSQRVRGLVVEVVPIRTSGDKMQRASLARVGGKGLFIRELEQALSEHRIDIAVHSMKDLPATLPQQFRLAAVPRREAFWDVLITRTAGGWASLPVGARLGTSSLRRRLQALRVRPNLEILPLRGNVDTRLRRLGNGDFDAIILAAAGLRRLRLIGNAQDAGQPARPSHSAEPGLTGGCTQATAELSEAERDNWVQGEPTERAAGQLKFNELEMNDFVPCGGQGALAVEALCDPPIGGSAELNAAIAGLTDLPTLAEVTAERAFLTTIGASCVSPVGVNCRAVDERLTLRAQVFSVDGEHTLSAALADELRPFDQGRLEQTGARLGERLGRLMLEQGASELITRG